MTDKHTPGPWEVTKAEPGLQSIVHRRGYAIPPDNIASVYWVEGGKGTIRANARLIAAAPTLYGLLVELYDAKLGPDTLRILQPWFAKVEPIIRAAKGEK